MFEYDGIFNFLKKGAFLEKLKLPKKSA